MAYRRAGETGESAVDVAAAAIRQRIRNGEIVPGQRLIAADLGTSLDLSIGPIREAFTRLSGEGMVEVQPHRGAVVRNQSREDLVEIYLVREVVEGLAARLAARAVSTGEESPRALEETIDAAREFVERFDLVSYAESNHVFHETIYAMAGSPRITHIARIYSDQIDRLNNRHLATLEVVKRSSSQHEAIARAIARGDEARSETLMRKHVATMGRKIVGG